MMDPTRVVLEDVAAERQRQEELKKSGKFGWTLADSVVKDYEDDIRISHEAKLAPLAEEFGEVARHVTETLIDPRRYAPAKLRAELVQLAACAVAWCESLDRENLVAAREVKPAGPSDDRTFDGDCG